MREHRRCGCDRPQKQFAHPASNRAATRRGPVFHDAFAAASDEIATSQPASRQQKSPLIFL
jgi:hypothetical protein